MSLEVTPDKTTAVGRMHFQAAGQQLRANHHLRLSHLVFLSPFRMSHMFSTQQKNHSPCQKSQKWFSACLLAAIHTLDKHRIHDNAHDPH
jgi:hypothetical protein